MQGLCGHWKLKQAIFSSWELRDQMKTLEALLHICIYIYTNIYSTVLRRGIPHSCLLAEKLEALFHTNTTTHINTLTFDDMQKFTVFAILPEGFVQSGELFIGQVCVGGVNS